MESMVSANFHITQMISLFKKDDPRDLLKYCLISANDMQEQGVAGMALKVLASRGLDLEIPGVEEEYN